MGGGSIDDGFHEQVKQTSIRSSSGRAEAALRQMDDPERPLVLFSMPTLYKYHMRKSVAISLKFQNYLKAKMKTLNSLRLPCQIQ